MSIPTTEVIDERIQNVFTKVIEGGLTNGLSYYLEKYKKYQQPASHAVNHNEWYNNINGELLFKYFLEQDIQIVKDDTLENYETGLNESGKVQFTLVGRTTKHLDRLEKNVNYCINEMFSGNILYGGYGTTDLTPLNFDNILWKECYSPNDLEADLKKWFNHYDKGLLIQIAPGLKNILTSMGEPWLRKIYETYGAKFTENARGHVFKPPVKAGTLATPPITYIAAGQPIMVSGLSYGDVQATYGAPTPLDSQATQASMNQSYRYRVIPRECIKTSVKLKYHWKTERIKRYQNVRVAMKMEYGIKTTPIVEDVNVMPVQVVEKPTERWTGLDH